MIYGLKEVEMKKNHYRFVIAVFMPLVLAVGIACALTASPPTVTPSPSPTVIPSPILSPLIGDWVSIDVDGSNQTLSIRGGVGEAFDVRFEDFGATVCGTNPVTGSLYAATAQGSMTAAGNDLTGSLPLYCQSNPPRLWGNADLHFVYDPTADSLTDGIGVVWHRK
jgi:hypothetical protein